MKVHDDLFWGGTFFVYLKDMPKQKRKITTLFPYHVTARCINRNWFRIPIPVVWSIFENYLYLIKKTHDIDIHSFVLMPNHFHLLISTQNGNLSSCMNYFMMCVSRAITQEAGRINQTFGGPFFSSIVESKIYYQHAYKYVYRNPVEANLCDRVEDYPFSTLNGLIGASKLIIPVSEDHLLFEDFSGTIFWLNEGYKADHKEQIQKALKKKVFELPRNRNTREKSLLEKILS